MRPEEPPRTTVSNGFSASSNGSTPRKAAVSANGHSPALNGSSPIHANGTSKKQMIRTPYYRNHNREELTRILIQGLKDMGYETSANSLSRESGYELESGHAAAFRYAVLEGNWVEAERILLGSYPDEGGGVAVDGQYGQGLVLAEGANKNQMLFWMRQQKYLELLSQRDLGQALMVLRHELAPLNQNVHQLHALSSLLMCPPEDLQTQAQWPGTIDESRSDLLQNLTTSIAPSVMIRDHRLAELLDQVKDAQINQCLYHNTSVPPSLYSDHMCNREDFPSRTWKVLDHHTAEVWHVQFSPDGSKLATAGQDQVCYIYDTNNFSVLHKLTGHTGGIIHIAWSPDSKKIITSSLDFKAKVWDVNSGRTIMTVEQRRSAGNFPMSAAAWTPDSTSFVACCHDAEARMCLWTLSGRDPERPVHTWGGDKIRVPDVAITPDGSRLLCTDMNRTLYVYDLNTYREEYQSHFSANITSITVSQDSRTALLNLSECEIHMFDLEERLTIRKFKGQKQGEFVVRSCLGGAAENFVLSGSEDGKIYIWHKENAALIETLRGHVKGQDGKECVTTVAWNPKDAGMFASGGDDRKVRIWTNATTHNETSSSGFEASAVERRDIGRTSALRSTYRGESNL